MSKASALPAERIQFLNDEKLKSWLFEQGTEYQLKYLLAHADDGVIWGRFDQGKLITADQIFSELPKPRQLPKLRLTTLQQCRVFGETGEVLLWRAYGSWKHRFIGNPDYDCIPEAQILWGTRAVEEKDGFTLIADGLEGLRHAVPYTGISFKGKGHRTLRLVIHHFVSYDEATGLARINLSRLVDLVLTSQ